MFGTIKAQLAEMTGFEVERGGRRGGGAVVVSESMHEKKKSESEDNCGLVSPLGF